MKEIRIGSYNTSASEGMAFQIYAGFIKFSVNDTLQFISGDSTMCNTGYKCDTFHFLEKFLNKRLNWIVSQLHNIDLKLKKLITERCGKTSSKDGWEGELGMNYFTYFGGFSHPYISQNPGNNF